MIEPASTERLASPAEYRELVEEYIARGVTDGLPVIPVTVARIEQMIAASGRTGNAALGSFPEHRVVTVQDVAENALMAGCKPEYMPLVLTAFDILLDPAFPLSLLVESSGSFFPYIIVNGPIRNELGVNCRANVFGPGFRANATIGRALRLGLINLAGATPGRGDRSALGSGYKYTCVVGEDEENSPWSPLHTDLGFKAEDSTVMVLAAWQPRQTSHQLSAKPEHLLRTFADELSTVARFNPFDVVVHADSRSAKAILVLAEDHRGYLRDAGWSKAQMQDFLYRASRRKAGDMRAAGYRSDKRLARDVSDDASIAFYHRPEDFLIISAGSGGGRSMIGGAIYGAIRKVADPSRNLVSLSAKRHAHVSSSTVQETVDDYVALVDRFIDQEMTDGWPVIPPDQDGVARLVTASGRDGSETIGSAPWRPRPITVLDVAVNAYMAGCLPEYMPLVTSMFEFILTPENEDGIGGLAASTAGYNIWFVVHGPLARQLGLNCGKSLFGPGCRANVTIGRAVRLGLMNLAGLRPNLADRSCLGQPFKYGSVIAENEVAGPWGPLHSTFGFQPQESAITQVWGAHPRLTLHDEARSPEELLRAIADDMCVIQYYDSPSARGPAGSKDPQTGASIGALWDRRGRIFVVLGGHHMDILRKADWSRQQTQQFLAGHAARTAGAARAAGYDTSPFLDPDQADGDLIRLFPPTGIHLMAAGGPGGATMTCEVRHMSSRLLNGRGTGQS